jgi:chromosome partitioning protein
MFTVALLAQKGGVGKSTLVRSLAVQAHLARAKAGIVDADPQATTAGWYLLRQERAKENKPPVAAVATPALLRQAIDDARDDRFAWLFIDTPAGVSELPATAAAVADLILIPCTPSMDDMDAMGPTVKLVKASGKNAFFVVNRGRSKGINDECAVSLTSAYGLPAVATHITNRAPIMDARPQGLVLAELDAEGKDASITKGKDEFFALWKWLTKQAEQRHG